MNSVNILEIITVYGSAFIILLLLITTLIFKNIRAKNKKRTDQTAVPDFPTAESTKTVTYPLNRSDVPSRTLPSLDLDIEHSKQNSVIKNIELLSPLKRGILWAEILGRPGGRRQRNT